MFDFDEIESDVQRKGAAAWKEGSGGMKEEEKPTAQKASAAEAVGEAAAEPAAPAKPKSAEVSIRVGFSYKGQRWNQEFRVAAGSTVLDLKKLMTPEHEEEAGWFQLMKGGLPAQDSELLEEDMRLEFAYLPPRTPRTSRCLEMPEGPPGGWTGEMQVTVHINRISGWTSTYTVKKGSSVWQLKEQMCGLDPTGVTKPHDFELAASAGTGRVPLDGSTVIMDARLAELDVVGPTA
mmetsp:Transcript_100729/g.325071  ORF Transcript_100729/g.325071 Transcript_100729/m.325071 type:complete len:235 (-) Transcript_100729:189-893(-)